MKTSNPSGRGIRVAPIKPSPIKVRGKGKAYHKYDKKAPAPHPWFYKDGTPILPQLKLKPPPEGTPAPSPEEADRVKQILRDQYER